MCFRSGNGREQEPFRTPGVGDITDPMSALPTSLDSMEPQEDHVFSPHLFASSAPFSHARRAARLWHLSGLIGQCPDTGALVSEDPSAQLDRMFANLRILLADLGLTASDLVKATVYLVDNADVDLMNRKYAEEISTPYPARVTVQAAALPAGARFQIDAVAEA